LNPDHFIYNQQQGCNELFGRSNLLRSGIFMTFSLIVKLINKCDHPLPHRRIKGIAGETGDFKWHHTQEEAIAHIEANVFDYFVRKDTHNLRLIVGLAPDGQKYLKTVLDNGTPTHLLELPDCVPIETEKPTILHSLSYLASLNKNSGH